MSPAAKSKSKDKSTGKAGAKEKVSAKPLPQTSNGSSNIAASAYNAVSTACHVLDTTSSASSPPPHNNGRFRTMDETDEHSGSSSLGTGTEYDSVSNNDSCSGESEDQQKEKPPGATSRPETIPGADNDKREKIRQKNERKHQRQKERRAQELHERCSGYLMSRKLEARAQKLVAMGFSSERATMALILNEGRVEESVAWLFDGGEETAASEQKSSKLEGGSNLKIDIADELARIAEMEINFKCTKQEVERVVVACEGDLDKAAETLRAQKQESVVAVLKPVETGDLPVTSNSKLVSHSSQDTGRPQVKAASAAIPITIQQRRDEREFNYAKVMTQSTSTTSPDPGNQNLQSLRKVPPKVATEWLRPQQQVVLQAEKQWATVGSSSPSASYSIASSLQVAPSQAKAEASRYVVVGSTGSKSAQGVTVREPVIMMQRPQSINAVKQNQLAVTNVSSPSTTPGWYQNGIDMADLVKANGRLGRLQNSSLNSGNPSLQQYYGHQPQYQPFGSSSVDTTGWGTSWNPAAVTSGPSSATARPVPSTIGLFTGWGSTGTSDSSSPVDWSMGGSMPQCDYRNIDWSLEGNSSSLKSEGLGQGLASYAKSSQIYDDGWSGTSQVNGAKMKRPSGILSVLRDGSAVARDRAPGSSAGSHEWTSPFEGKDLFGVSRQFATYPSL